MSISFCRCAASIAIAAGAATGQTFDFQLDPPGSGLNVGVTLTASLPGTMIGNWTADANPTGTRTKPGLFGTFGSTENATVTISLAGGVNNATVANRSQGSFTMRVDLGDGLVEVEGYSVDMLASGPLELPITVTFTTEAFRTRSPSSTYIAGSLPLPLGNATVSVLRAEQTGTGSGLLTPSGTNRYQFAVPLVVGYIVEGEFMGTPFSLPADQPGVSVLTGELVVDGDGATVTASRDIAFSQSQNVDQALPQTPFDLPTILPPGSTAHVLLNLNLHSVSSAVNGSQTLLARGIGRPCAADFNGDGGIDGSDVEAFMAAWEDGQASADVNADGGIDGADVELFFQVWEAGGCN